MGRVAERDRFLARIADLESFVWLLNRMPSGVAPDLVYSPARQAACDEALIRRIRDTYRITSKFESGDRGFWDLWTHSLKKPIQDLLLGDDIEAATALLRDPGKTPFFWGFDAVASAPEGETEPHELVLRRLNGSADWRPLYALWLCDALVSLAEIVGARHFDYPEIDIESTFIERWDPYLPDALLDAIEEELGAAIEFPNPFPGELGLGTQRGVASFRAIQALYQAWRISRLAAGDPSFHVLEIGAGLGRTAYFARRLGIARYTIVDIPLTNAAQANFLGRVLGPDAIALAGEPEEAPVRILPPDSPFYKEGKFDLAVNVDSLTEMPRSVAEGYRDILREVTGTLWSVNHEFNPFTVRELFRNQPGVTATRYPYPLRRGYVEELFQW